MFEFLQRIRLWSLVPKHTTCMILGLEGWIRINFKCVAGGKDVELQRRQDAAPATASSSITSGCRKIIDAVYMESYSWSYPTGKPLQESYTKSASVLLEAMRDCLLKIIYSGKGVDFAYAGKEDDDEGRQAWKRRRADGKKMNKNLLKCYHFLPFDESSLESSIMDDDALDLR